MSFNIEYILNNEFAWRKVFADRETFLQGQEGRHDLRLNVWGNHDDRSLCIVDLKHAFAPGKTCERYRFAGAHGRGGALFAMLQELDWSIDAVLDVARAAGDDAELFGLKFIKDELPGVRVFSPFSVERLKPLEAVPVRWTVRHVLRVIAHSQFEWFRCTGRYSDDYAADAAAGYGIGDIADPLGFVRRVLENPSGWRVWERGDGELSICCHTFNSNALKLKLKGGASAA
ncbi:MAG: hypothetical protein LAT63_17415 [Marinobacter sp.]|nr:hypothetical protein [Marinobacter sp.]